MAQIRHEINILDSILTNGASDISSNELISLSPGNYNGTVTFYFEIVVSTSTSVANTVTLRKSGTTTDYATCSIPAGTTSVTRIRSAEFTPDTAQTNYFVFITGSATTTIVKSARVIVIQNASSITQYETQIEIGNSETSLSSSTTAPLGSPKYWFYDSTKWDGTLVFEASVTYLVTSTKSTCTIVLQEDDGNFNLWHTVVTLVSGGSSVSATLVESTSFTPISGRNYRLAYLVSTTKGTASIYNAKIIIRSNLIGWSQTGNSFSIASITRPYLAGLNATGVAFLDTTVNELRRYQFDGTNWSQNGNGLTIASAGIPTVTALDSTGVAVYDDGTDTLRRYQFNGTDWSLNGNPLSIVLTTTASLAALNSTGIAWVDGSTDTLKRYQFDGTDWSQDGNSVALGATTRPWLTALNSTGVAFIDGGLYTLKRYQFDGTNWSQNGNGLSITVSTRPTVTALSQTDVVFIDDTSNLTLYRWNGTDWQSSGNSLTIATVDFPVLTTLDSTGIGFLDTTNKHLRKYQLNFNNNSISKLESYYLFNNIPTTTAGANNFLQFYDPNDWIDVRETFIASQDGTNINTTSKIVTGSIDLINSAVTGRNTQIGQSNSFSVARQNLNIINDSGVNSGIAQGFTALSGWNIVGCKFWLSGSGNISGGFYSQFISGNNPSGTIIRTSNVITGSGMPSTFSGYNFYYDSGISMASGTSGFFLIFRTISGGGVAVAGSSTNNPYTSGLFFKKQGGIWIQQTTDISVDVILDITMPVSSGNIDINLVTS